MSPRVVVASVVRYLVPNPVGGRLCVVDLDAGETIFMTLVPESVWRRHDPNPRGGTRGTRVVSVQGDRLVACDARTDAEPVSVPVPGDPPFVRGLAQIDEAVWLVGSQAPLALHPVDLSRGQRVAGYRLDGVEHKAVYAICPLPARFATPRQPAGADPHAFWKRPGLPPTVTLIPR